MISPTQNPSDASSPGNAGDGSALDHETRQLGEYAKAAGKARVQDTRESGAESLDKLAGSAEAAAARLRQDDVGHMSEYISKFASGMHRLSGDLREKSGDELLRDVSRMARENPALFMTGSVAIGLCIGRFARASRPSLPIPADEAMPYPDPGAVAHAAGTDASTPERPATGEAAGPTPDTGAPFRGGAH